MSKGSRHSRCTKLAIVSSHTSAIKTISSPLRNDLQRVGQPRVFKQLTFRRRPTARHKRFRKTWLVFERSHAARPVEGNNFGNRHTFAGVVDRRLKYCLRRLSLPNRSCSSAQPSTHPGTEIGSTPYLGILSSFRLANSSFVSDFGERPLAFRPSSFLCLRVPDDSEQIPANSVADRFHQSKSAALAAMAASTALPPCFRISIAICVASGWLVHAMPCFAMTSLRVVNACPVSRSAAIVEAIGGKSKMDARKALS